MQFVLTVGTALHVFYYCTMATLFWGFRFFGQFSDIRWGKELPELYVERLGNLLE